MSQRVDSKYNTSELIAIAFWLTLLTLLVAFLLSVITKPEKVFYLIDLDRQIQFIPSAYIQFLRIFLLITMVGLLSLTALFVAYWKRVIGTFNRIFGRSIDQFYTYIASDVSNWVKMPYFRPHLIALFLFVALGTLFRYFPMQLPVSFDESISFVWFSSRSWIDVISDYTIPNNHILYNLLVNILVQIFGINPLILRIPAFLSGLIIIPCVYWLIKRLFDERAALLTAGLSASAPLVIEYSTQGRGYTLFWLSFLIAFIIATYLKDQSNRFGWVLFVFVVTIGMYTIPVMVYGLAVIILWMLISSQQPRRKRLIVELAMAGIGIMLATLIVYLPAILRTDRTSLNRGTINELLTYPSMLADWVFNLPVLIVGLFIIGIFVAVIHPGRGRRQSLSLLLSIFLTHLIFALAGNFAPIRILNYLFFIFCGIVSYGLSLLYARAGFLTGKRAIYGWVSLVIIVMAYWGIVRVINTRLVTDTNDVTWVGEKVPGTDSITCCAEGYFLDAKQIVIDYERKLNLGDVIVAYEFSGAVETMRYYLLEAGRTPVLIHPYAPHKGLEQLMPYNDIYVLVKLTPESGDINMEKSDQREIAKLFEVSPTEIDQFFFPPKLVASYRLSKLYELKWRVEKKRDLSEPVEIPFNMFYYY